MSDVNPEGDQRDDDRNDELEDSPVPDPTEGEAEDVPEAD
jgi:hypothetical protein